MKRATVIKLVSIVAALAILVALPYLISSYYVSLISIVFISAILASSINMLAGDANLVSLGHAGIAAAAGYGLAWASKQGYDLGGQLLVAGILTVVTSIVYGLISMRTRGIFFLMVTLAAGMVCYGIAFRWSSVTGGDNGLTGISRPPGLAAYWQFYFFVLAIFVIVTIALVITSRSPFGLAMRGIRDSETRMRSLGYNVPNYKFVAVFLSGVVAGIAGVLYFGALTLVAAVGIYLAAGGPLWLAATALLASPLVLPGARASGRRVGIVLTILGCVLAVGCTAATWISAHHDSLEAACAALRPPSLDHAVPTGRFTWIPLGLNCEWPVGRSAYTTGPDWIATIAVVVGLSIAALGVALIIRSRAPRSVAA